MKSGYIAIIGQPNVGKSTLLNHLIGQKLSITSRRPQTTRHRILGIKTTNTAQMVYVDTPGMHEGSSLAMNRYLNKTADASLFGVDLVVWIVDDVVWNDYDKAILKKLKNTNLPAIFAINKIDRIKEKERMLGFLKEAQERFAFEALIPVSALQGTNLDRLEEEIISRLPHSESFFPDDQITDRSERFLVSEIIREKLIRRLSQELPHVLTVEISKFEVKQTIIHIHAVIWVEREGQKNIVIGKKGSVLKAIGQRSREEIEKMLGNKVYLNLWVKVKKGWSDSERALQSLGFQV